MGTPLRMRDRGPLGSIAAGAALAGCAVFVDAPASPWILGLAAVVLPVALMRLGDRRRPWLWWPLGLWLAATLVALLVLRGTVPTQPRWLGLPLAAWIQAVGLWLVPLVWTTVAYGLRFEKADVGEDGES